jgi:hypothetical protein
MHNGFQKWWQPIVAGLRMGIHDHQNLALSGTGTNVPGANAAFPFTDEEVNYLKKFFI